MSIRKERGLTLISTVLLIGVIVILILGLLYSVKTQSKQQKIQNIKTNMLLLQASINKISNQYILDKKEEDLKGTKLSEMLEEESIKNFLDKKIFDPKEKNKKYYVLDQENLNEMGLQKMVLPQSNYYIVEYVDGKVYSTQGIDIEGKIYYDVTEIEDEN